MSENIVNVMDQWLKNRLESVHTVIPGKFLDYYGHSERKGKVKPLIKIRNSNNKIIDIDAIDNVPVIFPSTGDTNIIFPINSGDGCLLFFSEADMGSFLNSSGNVVDADSQNRFSLTDCIALPGLWSFSNTPELDSDITDDDFYIIFQEAKIVIKNNTNNIEVSDGNDNVIKMNSTGISVEDGNGNDIKMGTTSVKINDNLEILQ